MLSPIISSLTLPNDTAYLAPALAYVHELVQAAGFSQEENDQIRLALEEAITNVIKHGFAPGEHATFELRCEQHAAHLTFVLKEKGLPFDPALVPVYTPGESIDDFSTAGLGTFLIRKSMDEVVFRNLGRAGKELRLTKLMRHKRIDGGGSQPGQPSEVPPHPAPAKAGPIHIRPLRPEDAIEVSRCAYKAYGYSYEDYIYYPDQITEMNSQGLLHSLVAVTAGNEIAGHIALKRLAANDTIAEIGVAFVKPEFRGSGVFMQLMIAALQKAHETELNGLFGRTVTSHTVSQKTSGKFGFRDCGLLLAQFPRDVEFKQLTGQVTQKESALVIFLPLREQAPRTIYPPARHRDMIATLYAALGIGAPPAAPAGPAPSCQTELEAQAIGVMNTAEIRVQKGGADALHAVRGKLRYYCLEKRDAIYLFLDLEAPETAALVPAFEDLGFFFAGILPRGLRGHDSLILQYLNNLTIDYNGVQVHSPDAQKLREYVKQQDPGLRP